MGALTAGLAILSASQTLSTSIQQRRQAAGLEAQANYEGQLLDLNASLADRQAADAIARGKATQAQSRAKTRQTRGSQRAALAASGLALDVGSALDLQVETAEMGELEQLTIGNNAAREAFGFKVEAMNYRNQANLTRMAGKTGAKGMRNQANATLLTGAVQTASLFRKP